MSTSEGQAKACRVIHNHLPLLESQIAALRLCDKTVWSAFWSIPPVLDGVQTRHAKAQSRMSRSDSKNGGKSKNTVGSKHSQPKQDQSDRKRPRSSHGGKDSRNSGSNNKQQRLADAGAAQRAMGSDLEQDNLGNVEMGESLSGDTLVNEVLPTKDDFRFVVPLSSDSDESARLDPLLRPSVIEALYVRHGVRVCRAFINAYPAANEVRH